MIWAGRSMGWALRALENKAAPRSPETVEGPADRWPLLRFQFRDQERPPKSRNTSCRHSVSRQQSSKLLTWWCSGAAAAAPLYGWSVHCRGTAALVE